MRVVFMGTPDFAVPSLDALIEHHEVVAVYSRADAATGRGRRISASPVKSRAIERGIPVEQPLTLRGSDAAELLASYRPDAVVVAAFGMLLPTSILSVPLLGCVNVHASVLPRWRGAAPIQRAILAGDRTTGVSIMRMEEGLDTGPVCLTRTTDVAEKTAAELTAELADLGAHALIDALPRIQDGSVTWTPQDDTVATYAAKLTVEDVALSPALTVEEALRRVRASGPSAPCRVSVDGKLLVVLEASPSAAMLARGTAAAKKRLEIGLADGAVTLDRIIPEGRASMTGPAYVCGARMDHTCEWSEA